MEKDELGFDLMDNNAPSQSAPQQAQKTALTFSVMPGFKCFFQEAVLRQNITLQECYEKVMKDHFDLQKLRLPMERLFKHTGLTMAQRSKELYFRSTASERFYIQSGNESIFKYSYGKDQQQQIIKLQRQLELYRRSGVEALAKRRRELKELRQEKERLKQKEQEEQRRRAAVLQKLQRQKSQDFSTRKEDKN